VTARRRLLVLAPFTPRRDAKHGGSRAIADLLAEQCLRHAVALVYLRGREELSIEHSLRAQCDLVREVSHMHPGGMARWARLARVGSSPLFGMPTWAAWWRVPEYKECIAEVVASWRPDIVQFEYTIMGQYASDLLHCSAPKVLVEYDADPSFPNGGLLWTVLSRVDRWAWRRYRARVVRHMAAVVVFTEKDRAAILPMAEGKPVVTIPIAATIPASPASAVGALRPSLLFVGSFNHAPNTDAAIRLVTRIVPLVRMEEPDAKLMLVGTNPPPALRRHVGAGVELAETVPDVAPYLEAASVVVVPLRAGGGMRVKVLDALAAGKALVASRLAVEGLDLREGVECCLAETDEEFARHIVHLLRDEERRSRLGRQARVWALQHLSWARAADSYARLYDRLLQPVARA